MLLVASDVDEARTRSGIVNQLCLADRVIEDAQKLDDLVSRDLEPLDQGVIEELLIRQILAPVIAVDVRDVGRSEDTLTKRIDAVGRLLRRDPLAGTVRKAQLIVLGAL